jgi:hypothetical protein
MDEKNTTPASLTNPKTRRVRCEVNPGRERLFHNPDPNVGRLAVLLKEVLQQIPDEQAKKLMDAYMNGDAIVVALAQNSRGSECKTAFQCAIGDTHKANTPILSDEFEMEDDDHARRTISLRGRLYPAKNVSGMKLPLDGTVN